MIYDLVIIGLGAMGSSSLYHASTQYNNILAIEQFEPTHNKGSSHGETRIIREAYYEGEFYVPMAQKSLELFLKLQEESKQQLYQKTGCLIVGKEKSKLIRQSYQSAVKHNVSFKIYKTNQELQQKVPGFTLPKGFVGLFDETAGILYPEKCIQAHIKVALQKNQNIKLQTNTKCLKFQQKQNGKIEIQTNKGTFYAKKAILSAGMWTNNFYSKQKLHLKIQQNTVSWFQNDNELYNPKYFPTFLIEYDQDKYLYGFPDVFQTGIKVGYHLQGKMFDSQDEIGEKETDIGEKETDNQLIPKLKEDIKIFLPNIYDSKCNKSVNCFYTMTPDHHFVIDFYLNNTNIVVLSPCSGHGFKFSSLIGNMACEILEKQVNKYDMFKIQRLQEIKPNL